MGAVFYTGHILGENPKEIVFKGGTPFLTKRRVFVGEPLFCKQKKVYAEKVDVFFGAELRTIPQKYEEKCHVFERLTFCSIKNIP